MLIQNLRLKKNHQPSANIFFILSNELKSFIFVSISIPPPQISPYSEPCFNKISSDSKYLSEPAEQIRYFTSIMVLMYVSNRSRSCSISVLVKGFDAVNTI
ncbi:hypothetical protein A2701_01965 [Candidatus Amesbacteria bacterium RIFCSPHIGHO2_01_FULL_47_34]|nr:MAG: hypothetical protein A2701_01965 [Candidatus Amesbacteria bacterium RIFCSPHIGHO2_01_FULL_47_34]